MGNKISNSLKNAQGKVNEFAGKITNNEELELKGKLQSIKSDMVSKGEHVKEKVQGKANDFIDNLKEESCKKD